MYIIVLTVHKDVVFNIKYVVQMDTSGIVRDPMQKSSCSIWVRLSEKRVAKIGINSKHTRAE